MKIACPILVGYCFQAYTPVAALPERVSERVKRTDPAEYANCLNADNATR